MTLKQHLEMSSNQTVICNLTLIQPFLPFKTCQAELRFISRHTNVRQRILRCLEVRGTLRKNLAYVKLIGAVPCMNTSSSYSHIQTSGGNVTILNIEI